MRKMTLSASVGDQVAIARLQPRDGTALARFYNRLSSSSIRTFRPLGTRTTPEICEAIAERNVPPEENYDLVAWYEAQIVGWAFVWRLTGPQPLFGLGVADDFQRQGLGSRLMDAVMDEIRRRGVPRVYLTAVKDNNIAWQMYARRGFRQYDERFHEDDQLTYRYMVYVKPES